MNGSFLAVSMDSYYLSEEKAGNIVHMEASSTRKSVASLYVSCLYKFYVYCKFLLSPDGMYETYNPISGMLITLASTGLFNIMVNFGVVLYNEF